MGGAAIAEAPVQISSNSKKNIMAGLEDISAADISESNWNEACSTFDEMNLKEDLLRGIYAYGFEKPSTIQQRGIVPIVRGHDTIAQAQSGTGKTATFTMGTSTSSSARPSFWRPLASWPTRVTRWCAPLGTTSMWSAMRALEAPRWPTTATCCAVACTLSWVLPAVSST